MTSYEIAAEIATSYEQGVKGSELADRLAISASAVSRKLTAFRNAGPELREAWRTGKLSEHAVQHLATVALERQAAQVAKAINTLGRRRGAARRPPIHTVRQVLRDIARGAYANGNYADGVLDALRWYTGDRTSERFAALVNATTTDNRAIDNPTT